MKRWLFVGLVALLVSGAAVGQQKTRFADKANPADYPLTVHVTHAFLAGATNALHLDAIVSGKKLQLESGHGFEGQVGLEMLHVGDYKARLVKDDERKSGLFSTSYELLFADGTHFFFNVVSESE